MGHTLPETSLRDLSMPKTSTPISAALQDVGSASPAMCLDPCGLMLFLLVRTDPTGCNAKYGHKSQVAARPHASCSCRLYGSLHSLREPHRHSHDIRVLESVICAYSCRLQQTHQGHQNKQATFNGKQRTLPGTNNFIYIRHAR